MEKLLRAYGGCLGAKCRRRTWDTAISLGKPCTGVIIRGFPNGETHYGKPIVSPAEYIGWLKVTWGTETSKYPEEKKLFP